MSKVTKDSLVRKYIDEGKSMRVCAKELGVSLSTINHYMTKFEIPKRDKRAAQKNYLKDNEHPMRGKRHSNETKTKISMSLGKFWDELTEEERKEYNELVGGAWKRKWAKLSEAEKLAIMENLKAKNKTHQGTGSRFEKFLSENLCKVGFFVEERTADYTPGRQFEVDLALPVEKILIEVDGPTHFKPIFGEEVLIARQAKDEEKNDVLVAAGYNVLRIRNDNGSMSQARFRRILSVINKIREHHGTQVWYIN